MKGETWNALSKSVDTGCGGRRARGVRISTRARDRVDVAFAPRGVGDFGEDGLDVGTIGGEAIVERDRVLDVSEVAEVGEHAYRPHGSTTREFFRFVPNGEIEWDPAVTQVIGTPEPCDRRPSTRPQPTPRENSLQLREVQIHHEDAIGKLVLPGFVAPVAHRTQVDRAAPCRVPRRLVRWTRRDIGGGCHSETPKCSATRTPLRTPSSWNPKPQYAPQ